MESSSHSTEPSNQEVQPHQTPHNHYSVNWNTGLTINLCDSHDGSTVVK